MVFHGRNMRDVITDRLWIGNVQDAANTAQLFDSRIEAVFDLASNEKPQSIPREIIYCRFPLIDGGDNSQEVLEAAIDSLTTLVAKQIRTLVVCSAGMSRSVAVTAAALALTNQMPVQDAMITLAGDSPHDVSPLLWNDIVRIVESKLS